MSVESEDLRLAVYNEFIQTGRAPTHTALAESLSAEPEQIRAGLRALHNQHHLVLDAAGRIVMAHPFSAVPLGFSVMGASTLWWGGCAWDSFAIPHLLAAEPDVLVATRCPGCGAALAWVVDRQRPPDGDQLAHFLVPRARMWDDVVHTCAHQRLFCRHSCVERWLAASGSTRGYTLDLTTLWRLARGWYEGRFERGYRRKDVVTASNYLHDVGLDGPFWHP